MHPPSSIPIVIADDHPIFRKGLRDIIESNPDFKVCAEADDGEAAIAVIRQERPRVAVLDIEMPRMTGIEVARIIQREQLPVAPIILTMYNDEDLFNDAMQAGVLGYVLKDSAILEILRCIDTVIGGECFVSAAMTPSILRKVQETQSRSRERTRLHLLTTTEKQILRLIADEKSTKEISELLHISPRTVDNHRAHICAKLEITGAFALIAFAVKNKSVLGSG